LLVFVDRDERPGVETCARHVLKLESKCQVEGIPFLRLHDKRRLEDTFTEEAMRTAFPKSTDGWVVDEESDASPADQFADFMRR